MTRIGIVLPGGRGGDLFDFVYLYYQITPQEACSDYKMVCSCRRWGGS